MTLVFSKSKEGTAHPIVVTPAITTTTLVVANLSYDMIDRLANSKKCGRCSGAK